MHIPRGTGLIHLPLLPRPITKQGPYNLHFKSISRQKKNYGSYSNTSPCKKYNLHQKIPLKETKILQDIIITSIIQSISSFNTSQNIIFQKSSYKNK
jgi:hypothetical protein